MDDVLIVVEDLEAAKAFFGELGMELEGETQVEGPWVGQVVGLDDVRADIAMMRTPDVAQNPRATCARVGRTRRRPSLPAAARLSPAASC
jgi:catechol 2,3-dioxygenase-like lactoylglutathione lyase family enzyme